MLTNRGAVLVTFLFSLAINAAFAPLGMMDFNHEAALFIPAVDLIDGKMLFRDSFSQYGPVPVVLMALAMSTFGKYVLVTKLQVALLYAIASVALYASWRPIIGVRLALLSVIVWNLLTYHFLHVFLAWASSYALVFQCIGLYFIVQFTVSGNRALLVGVGVSAMLTILSKQNVGVYFLGAAIATLAAVAFCQRRSICAAAIDMLAVALGSLLVLGPYLVWLASNDAVNAWWLDNFIWPRRWSAAYGEQFSVWAILDRLTAFRILGPNPYAPPDLQPDFIFALMPLVTLATTCYVGLRILRRRTRELLPVLALCLVSLASWLQFFPIPGIGHVWWSCAPMIGLMAWVLRELSRRLIVPRWQNTAMTVVVLLLLAWPVVHRFSYFLVNQVFKEPLVVERGHNPLRGMILPVDLAKFTAEVETVIRKNMGSNPEVLLDSANGVYLAFIDNPKFFHPLWGVPTPEIIPIVAPDYPELRNRFLKDVHPFVITDSWLVDAFLKANPEYKIIAQIDGPAGPPPYKFVLLH